MSKSKFEIHNNRPTSPHLTIYRRQISSVLSILHRISGLALFFGISFIIWGFSFWVFYGMDLKCLCFSKNILFKFSLIGISWSGFFHLCTGIRHLVWDSGRWFSIRAINITGWLAVISSFLLTLFFWIWITA